MKKLSLALFVVALWGCAGAEHEELQQWMNDSAKDMRGRVAPLPEIKPYEAVPYEVDSLLDPFNPAKIEPEGKGRRGTGNSGGLQPDFEAREMRNSIMEKYPLESMHMIGFMNINNKPMAAIQVDQLVKQVKVGDYVGLDFGVITKITEQEIEIREVVEDSSGDWSERMNTLQLQAKEGGK
ncbi:pilus assembly protein PilP [Azovibrio restrictus]|uniref:pilus assembly protein PilP n=1 Tax=Azovibrio restrictus TaxID=146938 RepID=UPI0026F21B53|nr:pilus assembly protein PilP [Azovibrio restrictus]MDD3482770.1 pilus assembly protein PilP [Azovibrio restrictus]